MREVVRQTLGQNALEPVRVHSVRAMRRMTNKP